MVPQLQPLLQDIGRSHQRVVAYYGHRSRQGVRGMTGWDSMLLTASKAPKYKACAGAQANDTAETPLHSLRAPVPVVSPSLTNWRACFRQKTSATWVRPQLPTHWACVFTVSKGKTKRCSLRGRRRCPFH